MEKITNTVTNARGKKSSRLKDILRILKRNKAAMFGLFILLIIIICAVFADYIAPYGFDDQDLNKTFITPCAEYWFGTDNLGRCIFSRIIYGARISLQIGFIAVGIAAVVGGTLGAIAGYYGKMVDIIIMRVIDVLLAIPGILLAISIVAAFGTSIVNVMIAVGISSIPSYVRIVRASVLSVREQEFVEAAKATGASDIRIIFKHIIPNVLSPLIVQATLGVAGAILSAASLSFIGLGIQPPDPEWGSMLSYGRSYFRNYPHVVLFPGFAIMTTIFALNLFGDGLRDALDPKLKR